MKQTITDSIVEQLDFFDNKTSFGLMHRNKNGDNHNKPDAIVELSALELAWLVREGRKILFERFDDSIAVMKELKGG